jgi:hypothetical protein
MRALRVRSTDLTYQDMAFVALPFKTMHRPFPKKKKKKFLPLPGQVYSSWHYLVAASPASSFEAFRNTCPPVRMRATVIFSGHILEESFYCIQLLLLPLFS